MTSIRSSDGLAPRHQAVFAEPRPERFERRSAVFGPAAPPWHPTGAADRLPLA